MEVSPLLRKGQLSVRALSSVYLVGTIQGWVVQNRLVLEFRILE
jgi:hypothetical protein